MTTRLATRMTEAGGRAILMRRLVTIVFVGLLSLVILVPVLYWGINMLFWWWLT